MTDPFVDTDVLIRLLTGDDPKKQAEAAALFEAIEAGETTVAAPDTVVADAVYVLSSPRLYHKSRSEVSAMLSALLRLPCFRVESRHVILTALDLYTSTSLHFGDAMIVASMQQLGSETVYSYDTGFDQVSGITRLSPGTSVRS